MTIEHIRFLTITYLLTIEDLGDDLLCETHLADRFITIVLIVNLMRIGFGIEEDGNSVAVVTIVVIVIIIITVVIIIAATIIL